MRRETPEQESREGRSPKRIFVEIGTNSIPVVAYGDRSFQNGDIYIGIDKSPERIKDSVHAAEHFSVLRANDEKNIHFVNADGKSLPLAEKSIDELYYGNVFGDPSISEFDKKQMLLEAARVLSPHGVITIKETNSPIMRQTMELLLKDAGFVIETVIEPENESWSEMVKDYSIQDAKPQGKAMLSQLESFIMTVRRP